MDDKEFVEATAKGLGKGIVEALWEKVSAGWDRLLGRQKKKPSEIEEDEIKRTPVEEIPFLNDYEKFILGFILYRNQPSFVFNWLGLTKESQRAIETLNLKALVVRRKLPNFGYHRSESMDVKINGDVYAYLLNNPDAVKIDESNPEKFVILKRSGSSFSRR